MVNRNTFNEIFDAHRVVQDREEFYWLLNKVEALSPRSIIEIGVEFGGSLKFWEQILSPGDLLIGIDYAPQIDWDWEGSDREIVIIKGRSESSSTVERVKEILGERKADFLFIDATHTPEAARQDWLNYGQFLRSGGIVGFHDLSLVQEFYDTLEGRKEKSLRTIGTGIWWKEAG